MVVFFEFLLIFSVKDNIVIEFLGLSSSYLHHFKTLNVL